MKYFYHHLLFLLVAVLPINLNSAELVQIVTPERVEIVTPMAIPLNSSLIEKTTTIISTTTTPSDDNMDSYLKALRHSQSQKVSNIKRKDPDVIYGKADINEEEIKPYNTLDHSSPIDDHKYPQITYDQGYSKPARPYLPPSPPPSPPQMYGPSPPQMYGPAAPVPVPLMEAHSMESSNGMPFASPNQFPSLPFPPLPFFPKLPKIDLQMILKVVLKLVLFKMLVKFLAVLCLLLVIPTLKKKDDDDDDRKRDMLGLDSLNFLTSLVWDGIAKNSTEVEESTEENSTEEYQEEEVSGNEIEEREEIVENIADVAEDKVPLSSESTAMRFLEFCVSAANTVVTTMMGFLRRQRNDYDVLDKFVMDKFFAFLRHLALP